mgnify:CR=1 FL=1
MAKKSNGIRLHPKYGLNPTVPTCFYCGKEKGEVAILGASYKGEAPTHMCLDLNPCEACKERFKDRTVLVETRPDGTFPGRWIAVFKKNMPEDFKGDLYLMKTEDFDTMLKECKAEADDE